MIPCLDKEFSFILHSIESIHYSSSKYMLVRLDREHSKIITFSTHSFDSKILINHVDLLSFAFSKVQSSQFLCPFEKFEWEIRNYLLLLCSR